MIGVLITAGNAMTGAAINNSGQLKLKDVIIESSIVPTGATLIQNLPGGQLFVEGNCALHQ